MNNIGTSNFNINTILNTNNINNKVQNHLKKVYTNLLLISIAAIFGVQLYLYTHLPHFIALIFSFFCLYKAKVRNNNYNDINHNTKILYSMGFGVGQGLLIGNLIELVLFVDESILYQGIITTGIVFGSFTLAALLSERRSYLYLSGILISSVSFLFYASLFNIFFQSVMIVNMNLYFGLLIFAGYIIFDTQMIIEKADNGDNDFVSHSLDLFVDLIGIFVRILIILLKHQKRQDERKRKNRR